MLEAADIDDAEKRDSVTCNKGEEYVPILVNVDTSGVTPLQSSAHKS